MIRSLLGISHVYSAFQDFVGGDARLTYAREYVRAPLGSRVLDIGCGPADILNYLPAGTDYTGFDMSEKYITNAKARFGNRGQFYCAEITRSFADKQHKFDICLANGVLHHLDDRQAMTLFEIARSALTPGGRLITLDGCFVEGQSKIARFLLSQDRGKFVRTEPEYKALAARWFRDAKTHIRHDLMRIPYTHIIMECIHE